MRLRVRDATAMLQNTDDLIKTIAFECGFSSGKHLCEALKRETGKTPREIRSES